MNTLQTQPLTEVDELVSLEDAAELLCVSKSTLYRMLEREEVKGSKVGRQWRFRTSDLQAYLDRGPQAVVLSTVNPEEIDAFLAEEARVLDGLGIAVPPLPKHAEMDEMLTAAADRLFQLGIGARASDIHLVPERESILVKVRIDGVLSDQLHIPRTLYPALVSQLKQMSDVNPDERALPQDGRLHVCRDEREYDLRVNYLPTVFGESVVMRILDQRSVLLGLDRLGMCAGDQERLRRWNISPSGLVICTGPTGSGKTTTLYSCLREVAGETKNTMTVEDPVECQLPHTRQTGVNRRAGLTFVTALRAFLRHDPDVIMVGEIRDLETAEIVVQAALTGHLVFTTLCTNNAVQALQRLDDMGVEPFLIGGSLRGIIAQRLLRQACPHCKEPATLQPEVLAHIRDLSRQGGYEVPQDAAFCKGRGCEHCRGFGYRGRTGLFELLEFTPAVREAFLRKAGADEITRVAVNDGMRTLAADGIRKAVEGLTTVDEVLRVTAAH